MTSQTQRCVDSIGELLGLPVSLTDGDLNSLLFSPHPDDLIDEVRRDSLLHRTTAPWVRQWFFEYGVGRSAKPVRVEPHPKRETMSRLVLPVQHRGHQLGLLCVLDPARQCDGESIDKIAGLVRELAELLYDEATDRVAVSRQLQDLLTGSVDVRDRAVRSLEQSSVLAADDAYLVATVSGVVGPPKPHPDTEPVSGGTAASSGRILQCTAPAHHIFLLPADSVTTEPPAAWLRRITRTAAGCCGEPVVGIGEPCRLADAPRSYEQARAAMSAAARLDHLGAQVSFADLGALRLLATRNDQDLEAAVAPQARPLLEGDDELLLTVATYLEAGCDASATAARLNVHRGTLYYRLRKAESATGLDLSQGTDRLALHLAVLVHSFVASPRRPGHPAPVRLLPL
jgi:hypothetical protein